jgi:hypothetical protein
MDFCKAELAGDDCPAAILTQFVDFIQQTNVDRWRDSQGFLTTGDLSTYWASFHGARPKQKAVAAAKTVKKDAGTSHTAKSEMRVRFLWVDVCHQWNTEKCNKASGMYT